MKKNAVLLITLICITIGFGQSQKKNDSIINIQEMDSVIRENNQELSLQQFREIFKKNFKSVIENSGKTTVGNYASTDLSEGILTFNATRNFENGDMLSLRVNGGATNGFLSVFNDSKINSNIGLDIKYNILLNNASRISYHQASQLNSYSEIEVLSGKLKKIDTMYIIGRSMNQDVAILLEKQAEMITTQLQNLQTQFNSFNSSLTYQEKLELAIQLDSKKLELDSIQLKREVALSDQEYVKINNKKRTQSKLEAIGEFEYTNIRFSWFSLGAGIQNNNFNRFISTAVLDSQLVKQNYSTFNFSGEWNFYNWHYHGKKTFYFLIGGQFIVDDNFSDLSKIELNDSYQYGDSTADRVVTKKTIAYRGDYETNLVGGKIYTDLYYFVLKNAVAIHVFPEVNFKQGSYPIYNVGIGLLYSFKDAEDKENKAKVNTEIYFKLSDLNNSRNSNLSLIQRNELGIRLAIPVSFFNF